MDFELRLDTLPLMLVTAIESNLGKEKASLFLSLSVESANRHAKGWGVTFQEILIGGMFSLCIRGVDSSGKAVVMKVPASVDLGRSETAALSSWREGTPRLLKVDPVTSVFLMEYIPTAEGMIEALEVFNLADSLHSHPPILDFDFPDLRMIVDMRIEWAEERFAIQRYSHYQADLDTAKHIVQRLFETTSETALLHGDFQRKNLLVSPFGLRTLDPFACIGDPVFDSAFWLGLVHHDAPLADLLKLYAVNRSEEEVRRFLCWTWAMSVIENRPYEEFGTIERAEFIYNFRDAAIFESGLL